MKRPVIDMDSDWFSWMVNGLLMTVVIVVMALAFLTGCGDVNVDQKIYKPYGPEDLPEQEEEPQP